MAVEISANTAQFGSALQKSQKQLDSFASGIKKAGAALIGAMAFKEIGQQVIELTAQFQRFEAILSNTLGSRSAAREALNSIRKFAAETPFEVSELTAAYVRWANQGLNPTIDKMRMLGDVASSLGAGFEQTAEAFKDLAVGQTKRIEEIGISAQQANGKIQLSFKGVNLEIEKNAAGVDSALNLYSKLPGVLGSSAAIAETMGGKISNLQDNLSNLGVTIGSRSSGLINGFLDFANGALGALNDALNKQSEALKDEQIGLNVLVGAITSANTSEAARAKLIEELNLKYPDFLKNLDAEKVTNEELKKRLEDVNAQFMKKIALAAAEEKLIEKQKEINAAIDDEVEARKRLAEISQKLRDAAPGSFASISMSTEIEAITKQRIPQAQREQIAAQKELNDLMLRYQQTWKDASISALDYFGDTDKGNSETKAGVESVTKALLNQSNVWANMPSFGQPQAISELIPQSAFDKAREQVAAERQKMAEDAQMDFAKSFLGGEIKAPDLSSYVASLEPAIQANSKMADSMNLVKESFASAASQGINSFLDGLGQVAEGEISFGDNMLRAIVDFMKTFGMNLIKLGMGTEALKNLFGAGGGPAAIAIGAALVGTAAVVRASMKKRAESLGGGGGAGGRSSASFNGQTVTASGMQSNMVVTGQLVGSGRDLVAVINQTSFDNKIRKGG